MENIRIEKHMVEVSIPWEWGTLIVSGSFTEAKNAIYHDGGEGAWSAQRLLEYVSGTYESAELRGLHTKGKKLVVTLAFSDKEEFEEFRKKHS